MFVVFFIRVLAGWVRTLMENSIIFFIFLKPSLRKTIIIFLNYDIINVSYHFWYRDFEILPEVIRKNFGSIFTTQILSQKLYFLSGGIRVNWQSLKLGLALEFDKTVGMDFL